MRLDYLDDSSVLRQKNLSNCSVKNIRAKNHRKFKRRVSRFINGLDLSYGRFKNKSFCLDKPNFSPLIY